MAMDRTVFGDDTAHSIRSQPARVYQEAALSLRYKRITTITATKLQRAMALLQLEPCHLIERGLASRSLLEQGSEKDQEYSSSSIDHRSNVKASCASQDDQDDGWGDYEDNYDSDSDIDDDEDQDDEIEGRKKGPIYAFLVYGGVQLRPEEYVRLFRALGVSPQYIEQLQGSNIEIDLKEFKALS